MGKVNEQVNNLKKTLILETASKYFKDFGYEKTQIDKISKELGIGVGTIYGFFNSKEGLFMAWLGSIIDKAYEQLEEICTKTNDPIEKLSYFVDYKLQYFQNHKITIQGYLKNNQLFLKGISRRKEHVMDKVYVTLEEIIKEICNDKNQDFYLLSNILDGIINSYIECGKIEVDNIETIKTEIITKFINLLGIEK